ncbi:MAG: hypothetical protein MAG581_02374 [Deltaproteobacteria bacterium]|nr:hypothetical protein [Deltaproteobacteria bacterium]
MSNRDVEILKNQFSLTHSNILMPQQYSNDFKEMVKCGRYIDSVKKLNQEI